MSLLSLVILGLLTLLSSTNAGSWEKLHREPPLRGVDSKNPREVTTQWIMQRVDNFDPQNPSTWSMRYLQNGEHYKTGGPLFIYLGGEWAISDGAMKRGHFYDMAKDLGAYLFYTEHRYYGMSRPTVSTRTDLLKFLNVDQALADLAHFVEEMRKTIPGAENAKVIMAGGSYSATMVAWFRQKYPHHVNGGWASSAPLLAKLDFVEYKEVVSDSIRLVGGDECADRIGRAYDQMEHHLAKGEFDKVREEFLVCENINFSNELDTGNFLSSISDSLAGVVQYHWPGDIEGVCKYINDETIESDMTALAKWFTRGVSKCMDFTFNSTILYYRTTDWNHPANTGAMRPWLYQTCAEYGWYQTSGSEDQIFGSGFPVELYVQLCADLYDKIFTRALLDVNVARTNTVYGHMNPEVTNVFFTQGQLDPWRPMGLQEDLNEHSPTVVIPFVPRILFDKFTDKDFSQLLTYSEERTIAAKLILDTVRKYKFDGIVLEVWSQLSARVEDDYLIGLVTEVCENLISANLACILVIPPARKETYDLFSRRHFEALAPVVTAFSLMTYDFSSVQRPGASAPLYWVKNAILHICPDTAENLKEKRAKILLGLNMYGSDYTPNGGQPIIGHEYLALLKHLKGHLTYDEHDVENFFEVKTTNGRHMVFYPTLYSINERLKLAQDLGTGISLWELGQGLDYFYDLF